VNDLHANHALLDRIMPTRQELLYCITCDLPLGEHRVSETKGLIVKCSRCGTLQHHRLGSLHG
jgi:hypothetical protein